MSKKTLHDVSIFKKFKGKAKCRYGLWLHPLKWSTCAIIVCYLATYFYFYLFDVKAVWGFDETKEVKSYSFVLFAIIHIILTFRKTKFVDQNNLFPISRFLSVIFMWDLVSIISYLETGLSIHLRMSTLC